MSLSSSKSIDGFSYNIIETSYYDLQDPTESRPCGPFWLYILSSSPRLVSVTFTLFPPTLCYSYSLNHPQAHSHLWALAIS